ncbi:MAG: methylenetetrahydrofolate reductase [NAD(P)H] [Gammaproteobacteria bacterium]|nr:methylenetetrahydrofolate reductase [NAD(P)H] [Gammaproteobacteria bacterium]
MASQHKLILSCEFYPPRTEAGEDKLKQAQEQLSVLQPNFYSVTFGAGGSTREKTFETVAAIQRQSGIMAAPHLSCVASSKDNIRKILHDYIAQGVSRIVALRGDRPSGLGVGRIGEFEFAADLVRFIRAETGKHFYIEVAAYPEFHPEAASARADLVFFKQKTDAGADGAITQYFYNADAYFRFIDSSRKLGVDLPIVPGIMPINNYVQLARFSDACGAEIPRWMRWRMEDFGDDIAAIRAFGIDAVTDLCRRLIDGGAPGLHFYTLNQAELTLSIASNLGLIPE